MKRFKGTKGTIILLVLICLIFGYYFYLSNRTNPTEEEQTDIETMTMTQKVLSRDLQANYPPSPRELVKYFSEITQCFYNEEHNEEELQALALKAREIYDVELVENQSEEAYLDLLKKDVDEYGQKDRTIADYVPSSSVDVEYFSQDGYECARLYCIYDVKQKGLIYPTTLCFVLRKDENSHYKIYGWKMIEGSKE